MFRNKAALARFAITLWPCSAAAILFLWQPDSTTGAFINRAAWFAAAGVWWALSRFLLTPFLARHSDDEARLWRTAEATLLNGAFLYGIPMAVAVNVIFLGLSEMPANDAIFILPNTAFAMLFGAGGAYLGRDLRKTFPEGQPKTERRQIEPPADIPLSAIPAPVKVFAVFNLLFAELYLLLPLAAVFALPLLVDAWQEYLVGVFVASLLFCQLTLWLPGRWLRRRPEWAQVQDVYFGTRLRAIAFAIISAGIPVIGAAIWVAIHGLEPLGLSPGVGWSVLGGSLVVSYLGFVSSRANWAASKDPMTRQP